jgi:hypothetical protein
MHGLSWLSGTFAICRFPADEPDPVWVRDASFYCLTRTDRELSIVCPADLVPPGTQVESGYRLLCVDGPVSFDTVGLIAGISACLAEIQVTLLVLSTYDTDYILIRNEDVDRATAAFRQSGYTIA